MNKLQIQSAIFNLKMTIDLAKFYHNIENIIPEHRRRFEEIGENSRLILKYVEETEDLEIAKEVTSLVRGWLYYLHDNEDNLSPMMVSIRECCHNLLRISEALKAIEKNNSETKKIIPSQKEEAKKYTSFRNLIQYEDKDRLLERLHFLIDPIPQKGSLIAAIIQKAHIDGYILELPNEATFKSEFKLECTWEAVRKSFISIPYIKTSSSYLKITQIRILD